MGCEVSPQAVSDKLAKPETVDFFAALTKVALDRCRSLPKDAGRIAIPGVGDIHLADSSIIALRPSLATVLPGTGGDGPVAASKLHATFNLTAGQFSHLALTAGTTSDHFAKDAHLAVTKAGDLILRDLGYWDSDDLERVRSKLRYFVSRIPLSVTHFSNAAGSFDLWADLAGQRGQTMEYVLTVGKDGIAVRVIAIRVPRAVANERAAQARKAKGRDLTASETAQTKWNIYATNLEIEQASAETVRRLYSLRWQIELLFKSLKGQLELDAVTTAKDPNVAKTLIWARLMCAAVMLAIRGFFTTSKTTEVGLLAWLRQVSVAIAEIRALIGAGRWLALARLLATIFRCCVSAVKHSKPSSRQKARQSVASDRKAAKRLKP